MTDQNTTIANVGDLAKPLDTLVNRLADAVGILYEPRAIRRKARAEADAETIRALASIDRDAALKRRTAERFLAEEAVKQANVEEVLGKTAGKLLPEATPDAVDVDWLLKAHDFAKFVSSETMQELWAKILAGEVNRPGSFSKRTLNFVSTLDSKDAELFTSLASCFWLTDMPTAVVFDLEHEIYRQLGITYSRLAHLDAIGLIRFDSLAGFQFTNLQRLMALSYFGDTVLLQFPKEADNSLSVGHVMLTQVGVELASISKGEQDERFQEYCLEKWLSEGITTYSSYPRIETRNTP